MRSCMLGICCVMWCLASTDSRLSGQDVAVTTAVDDENLALQAAEPEAEEVVEVNAPMEFFPVPEGTIFQPTTIWADGTDEADMVDVTAGPAEQLVYSNTLGKFGAPLGTNNLVSDDITTTLPGGCALRRYAFPVLGKVNPAGVSGPYTINFALYSSCPGSVPVASIPTLIIPGTQGQRTFIDQCLNAVDDDSDLTVNDGCPTLGPPETGAQCLNATDDDGDGRINDGCPAVGDPETNADIPRTITFVPAGNAPIPTNFWFGIRFSRNNAGVIFGTPPLVGFSCDQYDFPGSPCTAWAGGFPNQPQASFNFEIYADSACTSSFTGYKNNNPSGSTFNPGANVTFADDILLITAPPPTPPPSSSCNMIAYEIAVKGEGFYTFDMRNTCNSGIIGRTKKTFSVFGTNEVRIARFTVNDCQNTLDDDEDLAVNDGCPAVDLPESGANCSNATDDDGDGKVNDGCPAVGAAESDAPIPLPNNFFLSANISAASGGVVVTGQQACIGQTADSFQVAFPGGCNTVVYPDPATGLPRQYAGFSVAITCAGNAPTGACCDNFITNVDGSAVCRQVPEVNCPFPPRFLALRPEWVQGASCEPDPFSPQPCGVAACCKPDGECQNLTLAQCNALPPEGAPRQWQLGQYCNSQAQRCPNVACLARVGECTLPRCRCPCGEACLFPPPCSVGPECCDSCPPIGCDNADCCTNVCNIDSYCCEIEWDDTCADKARVGTTNVPVPGTPICDVRPSNDVCAPEGRLEGARMMTTGPPGNEAQTDSGRATTDPRDPALGCYQTNFEPTKGLQTVWYKFVATHTTARVETCQSSSPANDSVIGVYAVGDPSTPATQCNSLIPIGCSDDVAGCSAGGKNARVCVRNLIVGQTYYVLVASKLNLADGVAYRLDITAPCTTPFEGSANNYCPGGTTISDGNTAFQFFTPNETLDAPKPICAPALSSMTMDEWYNYSATCTGQLTVDTCGATPGVGPDTNLAIYDGNVCPSIFGTPSPLACNADFGSNCGQSGLGSKIVLDVEQGRTYRVRLADSAANLPSGTLKVTCVQAPCPAGVMTFTNPPSGVVDAGRPHDPSDATMLQGIKVLTATGPPDVQLGCLTLCETALPPAPNNSANSILSVVQGPVGTFTITLARPITAGALTTITYTDIHGAKSTGRFTSAPGNVNADLLALLMLNPPYPSDVQYLLDALNGLAPLPWGIFSSDINRTNLFTPSDLLEEIDQLQGNGAYDPWDFTFNPSDSTACPLP